MSDNYYIGETIYYPSEAVNFIVDLWREFTNGDAFPINETEFPRMDEFIGFLKREGHFEGLQGRWNFLNLDGRSYFWEFVLSPVHTVPISGENEIVVPGAERLMSPVDYGPGFEGFVRSLLYHMMNKNWINDEMGVPGSGLELSTDVNFRARLLRFEGINCASGGDYDCGEYFKIKFKGTPLQGVDRKIKRLEGEGCYKMLLFDIPKRKTSDADFCVYKALKLVKGEVAEIFNREYDGYDDVKNVCVELLGERNWSLYEIKERGGYWEIGNFYENVHKKAKVAFLFFITEGHVKVTTINMKEKPGNEYLREMCGACGQYEKLADLHFINCPSRQNPQEIVNEVDFEIKDYGIEHVKDMERVSKEQVEKCMRALRDKQSIYVNGPGGSGKSELIKRIQSEFDVQVLGSTAEVARRFDGGRTVHSFFKLFQVGKKGGLRKFYEREPVKFQSYIDAMFESCPNYVVIDEAGMLPGECIDDIDFICRGIRQEYQKYFGGMVFVIVLDETQLPAVKSSLAMYTTEPIIKIRDRSFTFDSPWRLRRGVKDDEELLEQFKYLEMVRFGTAREVKFIKFEEMGKMEFKGLEGTVLVRTNDNARKMNKEIYPEKAWVQPWDNNPFEFYMGMEVICISNIAKYYGSYKPINGERGVVLGSEQYNGETVVCVKFENKECKFRNYLEEKKHVVDLVCSKVMTINRAQGLTIDGTIYIRGKFSGDKAGFGPGKLYVAISRCTNLRNVTIIVSRMKEKDSFFEDNLKFSKLAVSIANSPEKMQPFNLVEKDGFYANLDNKKKRAVFTFKDKRYFKPRDKTIKAKRLLYDYKFTEYGHLFDHAIIIDHETAKDSVNNMRPICTFVKYYVGGRPVQFNEILEGYMDMPERASDEMPVYKWDEEFQMMEFSLDYSEHPIKDICYGICMILEMRNWKKRTGAKLDRKWQFISDNAMTDWGFNNNGFDVFFFFKEYLECSKWDFSPEMINAGTSLKQFQLKTQDKNGREIILYQTRDLMQLSGPGNFANAVGSWCKNISRDLIKHENLEGYMHPFSPKTFEEYYDKRGRELFSEKEAKRDFLAYVMRRDEELRNLQSLARNIQKYIVDGEITKGAAPLKLIVNNWGRSRERWLSMPERVNIIAANGGRFKFIDECYFPREHKAVLQDIADWGYEKYANYDLKGEFKSYARLDVFLTELLMRAMNDMVFKFGHEIEMVNGGKISIKSSMESFVQGTRTCLTRYSTTAQLVQQISFTNLPDDCVGKNTGLYIETEMYLLPRIYDKLVNGILGGKTLGRRIHYQSQGENDYMQYLDFSGMYMKILEKYQYPYGPYNYLKRNSNREQIKQMEAEYRERSEKLFTRCALFKVKVKTNPMEIEPVYGKKRRAKAIQYKTTPESVYVTNYELRVFSDYGVELVEIEECIYWKSQAPMFQGVMKYYAELKNSAEKKGDKVGRTFAKLMANSTFGTMAKSDKQEHTMSWSTPQELIKIFKQYPACGKFMSAPTIRGKYHLAKIKTDDSRMNSNIPYIGRFTLGASKIMLYDAIRVGYGEDRFSDENFDNMLAYGDTDSITLHRKCLERILEHDKTKEEKDQILFYTDGDVNLKAGKLTDELLDDIDKYFGDREYVKAVKSVNKNWNDVANLRIVEIFNPAAKSGGVKFKIPRFEKNGRVYEERFGYKTFCKGIPSSARVEVKVPPRLKHLKAPEGVSKIGHDKETYELFKFAYQHLLPLTSQRQDVMKKVIFPNSVEYAKSVRSMDIKAVQEGEKNAWGNVGAALLEETFIVNAFSKKRTHPTPDTSDVNESKRRRTLVSKEAIESVKRGEKTMFEISSGQKLWNHFPISNE